MASKKSKKTYTLDRNKFLIFAGIIVLVIAIVIIIIAANRKVNINSETDISKLNADKYSSQIVSMYNSEGMKEKFLNEYNEMQNKIAIYVLNNTTSDENSFKNLVKEVNSMLQNNKTDKLEITIPDFWNGKWSLDEKAKLKFRFDNSKIEPSWISDESVKGVIIKN